MSWWMVLITIFVSYIAIGANLAKYAYWKDYALQFKTPNTKELFMISGLWPIAFVVEPRWLKSLITPTMWLDPEFRNLYPSVRAEHQLDRERELEVRIHQHRRTRALARQQATLVDKKEEHEFERRKAYLNRDLETINQVLTDDIPVEIIDGVTFDQYIRGDLPPAIESSARKRLINGDVGVEEMQRRQAIFNKNLDGDGEFRCNNSEHGMHWVSRQTAIEQGCIA